MIPGRAYTLEELLGMAWRRKWLMLVSFSVGTTAAVIVSSRLPDRFRAETTILAATQNVSADYVRNTVATDGKSKQRLPSISEQILSRSRLEGIIQSLDLYADLRRARSMEAGVDKMRQDIDIDPVDGSEAFRVSYEAESPSLAIQVTERLAGLFIAENARDRTVLARETSAFLQSQLENARQRLVEQEKRLESYRLRYGPELPTQLQSNIQVIQNTQAQIQALGDAINRDRDRQLLAKRQLADLQSEQYMVDPNGVAAATPGQAASLKLEAAQAELRDLERRLTPQHPDVRRGRQLVADLETQVQKELNADTSGRTKPVTAADIAKRNKIKELEAEIESLDRQVAAKTAEQAERRAALDTYQARVEAVPTRESELIGITRDYDTLQTLYRSLLARKEDSKIAENLEQRQVVEQFKVLDPPHRPEKPFAPNRRLIDLAGAVGGLVFGFAIAALLEYRDKSVKVEADLRATVDLPVLGMIPAIISGSERRRARRRRVELSLGLLMVFAICVTAVWLTFRM